VQSLTSPQFDDRLYRCVRAVYNTYRTELMNRNYYGNRLAATRRASAALDIALAVGTSSAIGAWALWRTSVGEIIWPVLSGVAALLAAVKPFLHLPAKTERYTSLFAGHGAVFHDLQAIVVEIERIGDYTKAISAKYNAVLERAKALSPNDDPCPRRRLLKRCYDEVNHQLPVTGFWWPPRGDSDVR